MNGKQLSGRTITVETSGRPPKDGKPPPGPGDRPPRDERSDPRGSFGGGGGGNSRSMASSDNATRNLFVGNIPPDVTEADVMTHFSKYGHVSGVKFLPKKSDTVAAFVDFQTVEEAREAHDAVNNVRQTPSTPPHDTRFACKSRCHYLDIRPRPSACDPLLTPPRAPVTLCSSVA